MSVVKFNKGFTNYIVNVHIHRNPLLDIQKSYHRFAMVCLLQINHKIHFVLKEIAKYHSIYEHLD